jgi:hypothetical protein
MKDVVAAAGYLGGCPRCRRFAVQAAAFTRELRAEGPERLAVQSTTQAKGEAP